MKAIWKDQVLAEAKQEDLIRIEGNWYFPPASIKKELLIESDLHTSCFWKGEASYYSAEAGDEQNQDCAWYYPKPMEGSVEKVGKDFKNYVAFWHGVEVSE